MITGTCSMPIFVRIWPTISSDPKYRWLPTYSFAVKWIASNESFLENAKWINNLSFRGSYGIQGNIHESATPYLIVTVGDRDGVGFKLLISKNFKLLNPDLCWEKKILECGRRFCFV